MAEYIKRKTVIDLITRRYENPEICTKEINSIPAADVAPVVHGAWQVTDRFKACSVCGYAFARLLPDKYCPHCGAKMDGERKDGADG